MAEVRIEKSDYVRFYLSDNRTQSIRIPEPIGWNDDELEVVRNKKYHGVLTQFTDDLKFYGDSKDYIKAAFDYGGVLARVTLYKYELLNVGDDTKWTLRYFGLADFKEMEEEGNKLSIKFNSNDLEELIKSHETDVFEIERDDSIDGVPLDPLQGEIFNLGARSILGVGEQHFDAEAVEGLNISAEWGTGSFAEAAIYIPYNTGTTSGWGTIYTRISAQGLPRHSEVTTQFVRPLNYTFPGEVADGFFFTDVTNYDTAVDTEVKVSIKGRVAFGMYLPPGGATTQHPNPDLGVYARRVVWDDINSEYDFVEEFLVAELTAGVVVGDPDSPATTWNDIDWEHDFGLVLAEEALYIEIRPLPGTSTSIGYRLWCDNYTLKIFGEDSYEGSIGIRFLFAHDLYERIMYILTGKKNRFYSRFFGRTDLHNYPTNGYAADVGITHGFWVRAFDPLSEKYKSIKTSLKDLIDSCKAVFNIGVGIESINLRQRLRVESLDYFYQDRVVVKLPNQVVNVKRKQDKNLLISGIEIGYNKGGDYEDEIGLDEPNTLTSYVTPIRSSNTKYRQVSKYRADEYGMELARRKPQELFPDEDTQYDEHNWFIDVKRPLTETGEENTEYWVQKHWSDRLQAEPEGIHDPETFRSMFFTPARMLMRHAWIIKSALENYLSIDKYIKWISSKANSNLVTWAIGETDPLGESSDILIRDIDKPKFTTEIVSFNHPVSDEILEQINGTTRVLVEGSYENVPNVYFKFQYINEYGEFERGYLLSMKPKGAGEFEMLKVNEKII